MLCSDAESREAVMWTWFEHTKEEWPEREEVEEAARALHIHAHVHIGKGAGRAAGDADLHLRKRHML